MKSEIKILLALQQIENVSKLICNNEYEKYMISHLIPIRCELSRQLTNLSQSTKMIE